MLEEKRNLPQTDGIGKNLRKTHKKAEDFKEECFMCPVPLGRGRSLLSPISCSLLL